MAENTKQSGKSKLEAIKAKHGAKKTTPIENKLETVAPEAAIEDIKAVKKPIPKKKKVVSPPPSEDEAVPQKRTSMELPLDLFMAVKHASTELQTSFKSLVVESLIKNPTVQKHLKRMKE